MHTSHIHKWIITEPTAETGETGVQSENRPDQTSGDEEHLVENGAKAGKVHTEYNME